MCFSFNAFCEYFISYRAHVETRLEIFGTYIHRAFFTQLLRKHEQIQAPYFVRLAESLMSAAS